MFVWKKHIDLKYRRATDRDGNHVYSDVMTSRWAEATEKMVIDKDKDGYLLPIIFYTDGVQISSNSRNKITPVILTLGNFSDDLLQKDISKRVVAYLPNFNCYRKDQMISHLMKKLKVSKAKVINFIAYH